MIYEMRTGIQSVPHKRQKNFKWPRSGMKYNLFAKDCTEAVNGRT